MSDSETERDTESTRRELLRLAESGEDYDAALTLALSCAHDTDWWLRINALHCFGYIARVYRRLDRKSVQPLLLSASEDGDAGVAAAAQDALDDIETFRPS